MKWLIIRYSILGIITILGQNMGLGQLLTNNNINVTINPGVQLTVKGDIQNNLGTTIDNFGTIDLTGNWVNNSGNVIFGLSAGVVIMNGINQNISGTDATRFHSLDLHNGTKTLLVDASTGGIGFPLTGDLNCNDAIFDLNSHTLTIYNSNPTAITHTTGYILSEDADNSSRVFWANAGIITHTIPFGNNSGEDVSFTFTGYPSSGGVSGGIIVSTYHTAPNNTPLPVTPVLVTHINNVTGADNSANTVDRFWHIEKLGLFDFNFTYAPSENAANGNVNMRAQQWNPVNLGWNMPLPGQFNPTSQQVFVPAVPFINPVAMEGITWAIASQGAPLPIELLNFSARGKNNSEVICIWSTSSEINNNYFVLLKSRDGLHFEEVGKVAGAGNSNTVLNYSFTDKNPYRGISYYKLKQVDFDGNYSYSSMEKVNMESAGPGHSVYPNPTKDNLFIHFDSEIRENTFCLIKDVSGKVIRQVFIPKDSQLNSLSLKYLANGFYFLTIINGEDYFTEKIQVIK